MLIIHSEAEEKLVKVRQYMDALDRVHFHKFSTCPYPELPHFRVDFENKLEYLRVYNCVGDDGKIDQYRSGTFLFPGHDPYDFMFSVRGVLYEPRKVTQFGLDSLNVGVNFAFESFRAYIREGQYNKLFIQGGLIFSGPVVKDFNSNDLSTLLGIPDNELKIKHPWGTHT